jgi:hypothetical protein
MALNLSYAHVQSPTYPTYREGGGPWVHGRWLIVLITRNRLMQGIVDLDIYRKFLFSCNNQSSIYMLIPNCVAASYRSCSARKDLC